MTTVTIVPALLLQEVIEAEKQLGRKVLALSPSKLKRGKPRSNQLIVVEYVLVTR